MTQPEKKKPEISIDILYSNGETETFKNIHKFKLYTDISSFEKYDEDPEVENASPSYPILQIDFKNEDFEDTSQIRKNTTINFNNVTAFTKIMKFEPRSE